MTKQEEIRMRLQRKKKKEKRNFFQEIVTSLKGKHSAVFPDCTLTILSVPTIPFFHYNLLYILLLKPTVHKHLIIACKFFGSQLH